MKIVNVAEFRKNMKSIIDEVANDHTTYIVAKNGIKAAVIISKDEFDVLTEKIKNQALLDKIEKGDV